MANEIFHTIDIQRLAREGEETAITAQDGANSPGSECDTCYYYFSLSVILL